MASLANAFCAFVVLLTLNSNRKAEGCSCQPIHPQDLYCKAEFVIKALVVRARTVELEPEGKYKRIHKQKPEDKDQTESSGFSNKEVTKEKAVTEVEIIPDDDLVKPAPVEGTRRSGPMGPDSRMPGYNPQPAGLKRTSARPVVHPPGYSSRKGPSQRRRGALKMRRFHLSRRVGGAPGGPPGVTSPRKKLMFQYRISIVKTFKGLKNFPKERLNYVYTPPAPLCSLKLVTGGTPFILMGSVQDGNLVINLCDYGVDLSKLAKEEQKNVVRNMDFRYPAGCQDCHIKVCNRGGCEAGETQQPFQCEWKEWWTTQNPRASQFICMQTKRGKCKWYHPLRKYKPEDIDEIGH